MQTPASYKCDGPNCTQVRGETNHWLVIFMGNQSFVSGMWDKFDAQVHDAKHACGSACALKMYSLWLSGSREATGKTVSLGTSAEISGTEPQLGAHLAGRPGTSKGAL